MKILLLELQTSPPFSLHLCIEGKRLRLYPADDRKPDVVLRGTPLTLLRLFLSSDPLSFFQKKLVYVEGDLHVLTELQARFSEDEIEECLAQRIGDVPAYHLNRTWQKTREKVNSLQRNLKDSVSEYLQEELRCLPSAIEVENFCQAVSRLRDDAERLQLRFKN